MGLHLRTLFVCVLIAIPFVAVAQTDSLQQGDTTILLRTVPLLPHKDSTRKDSARPFTPLHQKTEFSSSSQHPIQNYGRARRRIQGYRIQVYTGGNNRKSKQEALQMKDRVQKAFPELSVYIHFQAPRWICRVGDFISREEARPYLKELRKQRIAPEANIIASPILRSY